MRSDAQGMFWFDEPVKSSRADAIRQQPPIPDTGWRTPTSFPNLESAPVIAIDCETYDPELTDYGPGWARGKGHIVGVSVAVPGAQWYFPIRHEIEPEYNLDPETVFRWLRHELGRAHQPKVGANIIYDVGWLAHEKVKVAGALYDVQYAEALLSERGEVNLDALGLKYLNRGKETNYVYDWCARFYGGPADSNQRKNLYRAPPRLVGPYAEIDAVLPLGVLPLQRVALQREGLEGIFEMECRLIPLLIAMRFAGVRVSVGRAEALRQELLSRQALELEKLKSMVGFAVDINSSSSLSRAFDTLGVAYGRTAKGAPSFRKDFLEHLTHPIGAAIREIRKLDKLGGTFVQSYILDANVNSMVYGQFHPLRGDANGTRSGRFAASAPNLQNLPSRDEELAPLVRGLFLPDEGHKQWRRYDYSQIEYRFLIHFAVGEGSDEVRRRFCADPDTDYHEMTLDLVAPVANWDISTPAKRKRNRKPIKNINFGLIYGMGVDKLAGDLGLSVKDGKALFNVYHKAVPFAKKTMETVIDEAQALGYITTILGRRSRFELWEPSRFSRDKLLPLPYAEAYAAYGPAIKRAQTHKALNRRLQGSAADLMKLAMLRCWEEGVFDYIGVPRLTVHDELDFSDPGGVDDGFDYMKHVMETVLPLRIPVRADAEVGPDWGHCA